MTNEICEKICKRRDALENIANECTDQNEFVDTLHNYIEEFNISSNDDITKDYEQSADSERCLRIGIVGPVKAGKSSLLNALLFEGHDILPKAATPMTAALTELEYDDKCKVKIDFFTDDDVNKLKDNAERYTSKIMEIKKGLEEKNKKRTIKASDDELSRRAISQANREAPVLSGAHSQYESIKKSSVQRKTEPEILEINGVNDIAGKLETYVGANGKYTPFTSKVLLKLPIDTLKDVCVVDTPGFNDPVPSRDESARKSLKSCDVVIMLSPTGQYLSENDLDVFRKITKRDGIRELYIVPSQLDSQLFNQEIVDQSQDDLEGAVSHVKQDLVRVTKNNITNINEAGVFDELLNDTDRRCFPTSGICQSMLLTIDHKNQWDSGKQKVWENLCEYYPSYFSNGDLETSKNSLAKLANIDPLKESINSVKKEKSRIFAEKLQDFERKYDAAFDNVKGKLLEYIQAKKEQINEGNIEKEISTLNKLKSAVGEIKSVADNAIKTKVEDFFDSLQDNFLEWSAGLKKETLTCVSSNTGSESHSYTTGHLWWKEEHYYTSTTLNIGEVLNSIDAYKDVVNDRFGLYLQKQVRVLRSDIQTCIRQTCHDNVGQLEIKQSEIDNVVSSIFREIANQYVKNYKEHLIQALSKVPSMSSYGSGKIEGSSADSAIEEARKVIKAIDRKAAAWITEVVEQLCKKITSCNFSSQVLDKYLKELEEKIEEKQKPKLALEKYKRLEEKVKNV